MRLGGLDSPEFTGFNDTLIIGIRGWEGTELGMGDGQDIALLAGRSYF
jgi:hypothetical protein